MYFGDRFDCCCRIEVASHAGVCAGMIIVLVSEHQAVEQCVVADIASILISDSLR
jgi:hypothetical protein